MGSLTLLTAVLLIGPIEAAEHGALPEIVEPWWQVAGNPDLGDYTSEKQQPVDFGIWQAADGTWQIWSCIRHTQCGGHTRLFYRWEGRRLTDPDWRPLGIAMQADPSRGEAAGGLQAPHVFRDGGAYFMVYGDWHRICLAQSQDGKEFTRVANDQGQPALFSGPYSQVRDAMMLKVGSLFFCYYMGHEKDAEYESAVFCRTSHDLKEWSEPLIVSAGGQAATQCNWYGGDAECPFVVQRDGMFYLFRNQLYGVPSLNTQYASSNPLNFGVGHDRFRLGTLPVAAPEIVRHEGQWYIAALNPGLDGIRIARLKWTSKGCH
jgi:hypothetical protein